MLTYETFDRNRFSYVSIIQENFLKIYHYQEEGKARVKLAESTDFTHVAITVSHQINELSGI